MIRILADGLNCYAIIKDDAALGWISRSHWHGKWRALSASGKLSFHYSRMGAVDAIVTGT